MSSPVVFVQRAFVTGLCWERFQEAFTARGWTCHAAARPHLEGSPEALRASPGLEE